MKILEKFTGQTYAAMRITMGYLFMWHGTQKFLDFPKPGPEKLNLMLSAAGGIEIVGGILVMIGLFTRVSAFICSGTMAVAYWMVHAPQGSIPFPINNGGELSVLFTFVFLYIACKGSGPYSLDHLKK